MAAHAHITPRADPQRLRMERAVEKMLAAAERLLAELDALDVDADAEPSLGSAEGLRALDQRLWGWSGTSDREAPDDDEPAHGASHSADQTGWGASRGDHDDEPSLGSLSGTDQRHWGDHEGCVHPFLRGRDVER